MNGARRSRGRKFTDLPAAKAKRRHRAAAGSAKARGAAAMLRQFSNAELPSAEACGGIAPAVAAGATTAEDQRREGGRLRLVRRELGETTALEG